MAVNEGPAGTSSPFKRGDRVVATRNDMAGTDGRHGTVTHVSPTDGHSYHSTVRVLLEAEASDG